MSQDMVNHSDYPIYTRKLHAFFHESSGTHCVLSTSGLFCGLESKLEDTGGEKGDKFPAGFLNL
jgi:hypothetical protein